MRILFLTVIFVVGSSIYAATPAAQGTYQVRLGQVNIGNSSASGNYAARSTLGQTVVGSSRNAYSLNSGWWYSLENSWPVNIFLAFPSLSAELRDDVVVLQWNATALVELDGFHVYRSQVSGQDFVRINRSAIEPYGASISEYRDDEALGGVTYYYKIGSMIAEQIFYSQEVVITLPPRPTTLYNNYPNPFNPATTITFYLEAASRVSLSVFDVKGTKIYTLLDEAIPPGRHTLVWNGVDDSGRTVASGVYFYRLTTNRAVMTNRMLLLK